jgi:hypothetical protein
MKTLVLFVTMMALGSQVFAAATLRVPFILANDSNGKTAPVAKLNKQLVQAGLPTLPEYIEIKSSDNGRALIAAAREKLDQALISLGEDPEEIRFEGGDVPTAVDLPGAKTCYIGNAMEVIAIAESLTDSLYSEQFTPHALKYKSVVISLHDAIDLKDPSTVEWLEQSSLWKNWKGNNENLLIMSSVSDSGDDLQESLIPTCL